jgi:DNA-binding NarL/FixJ family response regulator
VVDDRSKTAVVLDRQPLWLAALTPILQDADVVVIGAVSDAGVALALLEEHRPDLFLVEPASAGVAMVSAAIEIVPTIRIIAIGTSSASEDINAVFAAGAVAYIVKTASPADVQTAVRQAFRSSFFLPGPNASAPVSTPRGNASEILTDREAEILKLAAAGRPNAELARMLWVTEQTVKFHLSNIYRKLGVANRTEASRWAQLNGLLDEDGGTQRDPA